MFGEDISEDFSEDKKISLLLEFIIFLDIFEIFAEDCFLLRSFGSFTLWVFTLKPFPKCSCSTPWSATWSWRAHAPATPPCGGRERGATGAFGRGVAATHSGLQNKPRQGCSYTVERDRGGCSVCPTKLFTECQVQLIGMATQTGI